MGHVKITEMTRDTPGFYETLGPFLSRREIVKELGGPIWDDDGKRWFVARKGPAVAGFAGLLVGGAKAKVASVYVLPVERTSGVARKLLAAILERTGAATVVATATKASAPLFRDLGFRATGKRGAFTTMERS